MSLRSAHVNAHLHRLRGRQHVGRLNGAVFGEGVRQGSGKFKLGEVVTVCDHLGFFICCQLEKAAFGDAHNVLFLAAPWRTGKTTFLRGDLCPALERAGVVVVYVDLWADTARDPGVLILFLAVEGSESSVKLDWAALSTALQESPNG